MQKGEEEFFHFNGYATYYSGRPNKSGGGSAVFIKNTIKHELIETCSDDENSIACVKVYNKNKIWTITNVYRPPNTKQEIVNNFNTTIDDHLSRINNHSGNILITGDFNFNTIEENDRHVQQYLKTMLTHNLHICNTNVVTRNVTQTALDHILTNNFAVQIILRYVYYDILDHRLIFVELCDTAPIQINCNRVETKKTDLMKLKQSLQETPITINTNETINKMCDSFIKDIQWHVEKCSRTKTKRIMEKTKPWFDDKIEKQIKIKNYWYNKKN